VIDPSRVQNDAAVEGGRRLLNADAFCIPNRCSPGVSLLGRNALTGPGLGNLDLSLSRSFALKLAGESGRITFRADAFNVLNHANLGNPASELALSDTFGNAFYGRQDRRSASPAVIPLNETPRQIQLMLRVEW
jgi:hypothetical protein